MSTVSSLPTSMYWIVSYRSCDVCTVGVQIDICVEGFVACPSLLCVHVLCLFSLCVCAYACSGVCLTDISE